MSHDDFFARLDDPAAIADADIPQLREQVRAFGLEARDAGDVDLMSRCADYFDGLQYVADTRAASAQDRDAAIADVSSRLGLDDKPVTASVPALSSIDPPASHTPVVTGG